jgi:hypothetical protein
VVEESAEGGRGRRGFAAQQAVRAGLRWWAGVALATCTSARKIRCRGTSGRCHAAVAAGDWDAQTTEPSQNPPLLDQEGLFSQP